MSAQLDSVLYRAYERHDTGPWKHYVDASAAKWDKLNHAQRARLVSYEYGFVADMINQDSELGEHYLELFESHLSQVERFVPKSTY